MQTPGPDYEGAFLDALTRVKAQPTGEDTVVEETVDKEHLHATTHVADVGGVTLQNLWRHPDTHPVTLDLLLIRKYGLEWMEWEPETLEVVLPGDLKTEVSALNFSKIQAMKTLHVVESFWERWEIFVPCTIALNGEAPDFEVMQVPTVAQCLVAADVAARVRGDVPWSVEMKTFLDRVHLHDGILVPIPPLDFVHVDVEDHGVNLEEVRRRWPDVRARGVAPAGSTAEDEQLRRLLIVHGFLEESRARLNAQLRIMSHV